MFIEFSDVPQELTIPSDLTLLKLDKDPFYRYKMPELEVEHQKKYTLIKNLAKVAKALFIPLDYVKEWFQLSFKVAINEEGKKHKLKAILAQHQLQRKLDKFIIDYLICPICNYPELRFYASSTKKCEAECNSCGNKKFFDEKQPMYQFIVKNPIPRTKQQEREEELDRIYGNRPIQYVSQQEDTDHSSSKDSSDESSKEQL